MSYGTNEQMLNFSTFHFNQPKNKTQNNRQTHKRASECEARVMLWTLRCAFVFVRVWVFNVVRIITSGFSFALLRRFASRPAAVSYVLTQRA